MSCQKCAASLRNGNRSGFCFRHAANGRRDARRKALRARLQRCCSQCGALLRRIHPQTGLCARCYHKQHRKCYLHSDVIHVLRTYQGGLCWWCRKPLLEQEAIGHHIYPYTMIPDNDNADENCGATHSKCHKEIHSNFSLEDYAVMVCYV